MAGLTEETLQAALVAAGVPAADAAMEGSKLDGTMKQCILTLYRSAVNAGAEWEDDLRRVSAPGLVLWGEKDPLVPLAHARAVSRALPHATSLVLEKCGHVPQYELPDQTNRLLTRFLA